MELRVQTTMFPQRIEFNYEELKAEITEKAELYKNMVYTEETVMEAKADKAKLNKFITALEDKRKEVKNQCLEPYTSFEQQIKELVAIVDEPVKLIDTQVKTYEKKKKDEKLEAIKEFWESTVHPEWLKCNQIFDQRWLNATFSLKRVQEVITERLAQIETDLQTLSQLPEFAFEATEVYKTSLDMNNAISEGQRLADIQRRKTEAESEKVRLREEIRKKRAEMMGEAASVTEEKATPVSDSETGEPEPRKWIRFAAKMSVSEAQELNAFFKDRNIEFKAF